MKIAFCTEDFELIKAFEHENNINKQIEIINTKVENVLLKHVEKNDVDAYVLCNNLDFCQDTVKLIKKNNPYVPIVIIKINDKHIDKADMYVCYINVISFFSSIIQNI